MAEPIRRKYWSKYTRATSSRRLATPAFPPGPTPAVTAHSVLAALPSEAVEAFVASGAVPGVFFAELRHLSGAVARRPDHAGAIGSAAGAYLAHTVAMVPAPEAMTGAVAAVRSALAALAPCQTDELILTFVDGGDADRGAGFGDASARLHALKRRFDPNDTFAAAHAL